MKIDTNKDGYDELHILAADARSSRRRANVMTTGLIVGGMIAASAYVSTTNDQVDQLANERQELKETVEQLKWERDKRIVQLEQLQRDRENLVSQREFYKDSSKVLADVAQNQELSRAVAKVSLNAAESGPPRVQQELALANLVWFVDGSRRFPLANGDILWVPEGDFSIVYKRETENNVKKHTLTRHKGRSVGAGSGTVLTELPHRESVPTRGSSNCIEITLHETSIRPGFRGDDYVDIEVLYTENASCPEG